MASISLAQLYNSGYGRSGNAGNVAPPKTELELTSTFTVPAPNSTSTADVSTAQYLAVGQFIFLSEGNNYGSFQITAISDKTLTLKNYGGEIVGSVFGAGARLVPSGRDGDDAVPADVVSGTTYRADRSVILNSLSTKMAIADYDTDADGIVDAAAGVDGVDAAGNSKYYGTDDTGTPGFHDLPAAPAWGQITGTLTDQTDLQNALDDKFDSPTGTTSEYLRGDGTPATFPTIPTVPTFAEIATGLNALTGNERVSFNALKDTAISTYGSFFAASPTVKNIPLFTATRATTINELRGVDTSAGTATISIQINGVNVTGLTNLAVTTTPQNFTATGANTVAVGARVTVNITAVSGAADLEFTMGATLT